MLWIVVQDTWRESVSMELKAYQKQVVTFIQDGYDIADNVNLTKTLSFSGWFLYSLTVITTIGEY